jgi:hypothetical protein
MQQMAENSNFTLDPRKRFCTLKTESCSKLSDVFNNLSVEILGKATITDGISLQSQFV